MTSKSKGYSVRQKLIIQSKKINTSYPHTETIFLIERLLARFVANKKLGSCLVFKGGFVGLKVYGSPRYTIDLDAILINSNIRTTLELTKLCAESDLDDGVWFRFEGQVDLTTQGEYGGVRQVYRAGIGEVFKKLDKAQQIHFDLGVGDPVTPAPKKIETPSLVSHHQDISWSVYPAETIVAEKLHALISHGDTNSRSKDIFDLVFFLPKTRDQILIKAIKECFKFRDTALPESFAGFLENLDTIKLEKGWASASASVPEAPVFADAYQQLIELLESRNL